jgi:D-alanyl-D-alanine carboxypeptidase (penicillin-binding protein 5/6)
MKRRTLLRHAALALPAAACLPRATAQVPGLPSPPRTTAKACIVVDAIGGQILYEKNADERRAVASTQKLLSALVCIESTPLDKTATVSAYDAAAEPHKMSLKAGERYPLKTLLQAMLIESFNDAARCVASTCAGSEPAFAVWMTRRAHQLGMKNSLFKNASGLPAEGQYSTARDMSRVARAVLYNSTLRPMIGRHEISLSRPDGRIKKCTTTNHLLRPNSPFYLPHCVGMKTGFTNLAGKCLISAANYRGRTLICVMLGSTMRSGTIWKESTALLNWGLGLR